MLNKNTLQSEYPDIAALWHPILNNGLSPNDVAPKSNKNVWWTCIHNHAYQRTIYNQVEGKSNCPICNGKHYVLGENDLKTRFPKIAAEWNYKKNGKNRPEDFSFISMEKVWWCCSVCGYEWEAKIKNRCVRGNGCNECANKNRWKKRFENMNLGIIDPKLLEEWDYELNKKGPEFYTPKSNARVHWHCKKCGYRYTAKICNKANGRKCGCCQRKVVVSGINYLATTHPRLAEEWDYEKNGDLRPENVLYGTNKSVYWKCPKGHSYKASINHRSSLGRETNCPICFSGRQTSFAEQAVYFYVKKAFPDAINRFTDIFDNGMELDIYIPSIKLAIEYDGEAWHKKDKVDRERRKWEICKENKIRLIRLIEKMRPGEQIQADEGLSIEDGPMYEPKQLQNVIRILLDNIGAIYCIPNVDINIFRDEPEIRKYMMVIKGSLAEKYPDLSMEWDYDSNGNLTPDKVKPGSDIKVGWVCPDCGNRYTAAISKRTGKVPTGCRICGIKKNALSRGREVEMIDAVTGKVIREYPSIAEASRDTNINQGNIGMVLAGTRKKAGGYSWRYCE